MWEMNRCFSYAFYIKDASVERKEGGGGGAERDGGNKIRSGARSL